LRQYGISAGQNAGHSWDANHQKQKSVTLMELEQRHGIKFLHVKNLKLDEIATELSGTDAWGA
jgi:hypothetical protein